MREPFWWPMMEPPLPASLAWSVAELESRAESALRTNNGWLYFIKPTTAEDLEMK